MLNICMPMLNTNQDMFNIKLFNDFFIKCGKHVKFLGLSSGEGGPGAITPKPFWYPSDWSGVDFNKIRVFLYPEIIYNRRLGHLIILSFHHPDENQNFYNPDYIIPLGTFSIPTAYDNNPINQEINAAYNKIKPYLKDWNNYVKHSKLY